MDKNSSITSDSNGLYVRAAATVDIYGNMMTTSDHQSDQAIQGFGNNNTPANSVHHHPSSMNAAEEAAPSIEKLIITGGTGTEKGALLIPSVDQFKAFRNDARSGKTYAGQHVKLTVSIDISEQTDWPPIGTGARDSETIQRCPGPSVIHLTAMARPFPG